jgi:enamine deaminase RidA (YjgF/YER057c/UK114 family)
MSIRRINIGKRMSSAVVHGNIVYLAGQVARHPQGTDVVAQTKDVLEQIDLYLKEAGSDKTKILSATIWLKSMGSFPEMNSVWDIWVPQGHTPARATVEAALATPDYLVEIAVIAAI